jgi:hypothetical protein
VAGTVQGGNPERAVVYADRHVRDLLPAGVTTADFTATRSTATDITDGLVIVGEVRGDVEQPGRPNTKPAAFLADGRVDVALDIPSPWGSRAVACNGSGLVLVLTSVGPGAPRSVVWNLATMAWQFVGGPDAAVFPLAITADGVVFGQARNVKDEGIAAVCAPGGSWELLGTADGMWPVDLNDGGEAVGYARVDGLNRPWLRLTSGEVLWLPYIRDHHTSPSAINNRDVVLGGASADHGTHVLVWEPAA